MLLAIILIIVGIAAGIVSTVSGLASLVAYPALLLLGLSPINANVTDTLALVFNGISATVSSRRELRGHWHELLIIMPVTLIGCVVGSLLLFALPANDFKKVVPLFILLAGLFILIPRQQQHHQQQASWLRALLWFGVFLAGVYSGYFGAASGVVMLALLLFLLDAPFAECNAEKNATLGAANVVSSIVYMTQVKIKWLFVIPLSIGFLIGGYVGPKIVRYAPVKPLKILISIGAFVLSIVLFMQNIK